MSDPQNVQVIQQQAAEQPTEIYHKTHRSYMIVAGLLAAWELIGLEFIATKEKPTKAVFSGIEISVRNPGVFVWLLVFLLIYFSLRFTLIWQQQTQETRDNLGVKRDFLMAHVFGILGGLLWLLQFVIPKVNVGEYLNNDIKALSGILMIVTIMYLGLMTTPSLKGIIKLIIVFSILMVLAVVAS